MCPIFLLYLCSVPARHMTLCTSPRVISQMKLWASWGLISWCGSRWYPSTDGPSSPGSTHHTDWRSLWLTGWMQMMDSMMFCTWAQVCWRPMGSRNRFSIFIHISITPKMHFLFCHLINMRPTHISLTSILLLVNI